MKKMISLNEQASAGYPYSPAIQVGNMMFVSGQLGVDPTTDVMAEGVKEQTSLALQNLKALLEKAGYLMDEVVKTTVFVTDESFFVPMNEVYVTYFTNEKPARSAICVKALPKGGLVEVEAIAVKG